MSIHVISLKEYWFNESNEVNDQRQKFINHCLDQIVAPDSIFCKTKELIFGKESILKLIEYGDYIFLSVDKKTKKVDAFAVCMDKNVLKPNVWLDQIMDKHGTFEIALICSVVPQKAKKVFDTVVRFAKKILLRNQIQLESLNIPKLIQLYESWGFVQTDSKNHILTFKL